MTLQVLIKNHTGEDRTVVHTAEGIVGHSADRTDEVALQDLSVCTGFARHAESRMDLRTAYPTDQDISRQSSNNIIPIVVF
jgi:hypothetical protein